MSVSDFKSQFTEFMEAVSKKDRASFLKFVDSNSFLSGVFAEGEVISGHALFVASQEAWFSSKNGSFSYKLLHLVESEDLGFASIEASFSDIGLESTDGLRLYISLLFQRYGRKWQLLHVQNTELAKA
jgi:hypothetical protein